MWAYVAAYEMPNDDPEGLRARVRVDYPVAADRVIGLGELPGVRLQRRFARGDLPTSGLTKALAAAHWVWFLVPHGTLLYVLARRRDRFAVNAVRTYAVFNVGASLYWIVPTAPPWYAAAEGRLPELEGKPQLRRLMIEYGEEFWGDRWGTLFGALGGNPLAAMPSLHFATSVMAAHVLADVGPVSGAIGWTYAATLGFALVYLGEHYVVDLVAGLALTESIRAAEPVVAPLVRGFGDAVAALERQARGASA